MPEFHMMQFPSFRYFVEIKIIHRNHACMIICNALPCIEEVAITLGISSIMKTIIIIIKPNRCIVMTHYKLLILMGSDYNLLVQLSYY